MIFIVENCKCLESCYICFVIFQHPEEEGYLSVIELFNFISKGDRKSENVIMTIDILTNDNLKYYS